MLLKNLRNKRTRGKKSASRRRFYGGGSGISVSAEQYGVYAPGNPAGGKADFEAMSRDAADSMIAYPEKIFPTDLVEQGEVKMRGGSVAMNNVSENNGAAESVGTPSNSSASPENMIKDLINNLPKMGGRKRATRKGRGKARRNTMNGGKRALSSALKSWNKAVMKVYREMKSKNKNIKLKDAMKEAKRRKDRGQL